MAQIMEPEILDPCGLPCLLPGFLDEGGLASTASEDEITVDASDPAPLPEYGRRQSGDRQRAALTVLAVVDDRDAPIKVHVLPFEAEQFSLARSGAECRHNQRVEPAFLTRLTGGKQGRAFVLVEEADAPAWFGRAPDLGAGVVVQPKPILGGRTHSASQDREVASDGAGRRYGSGHTLTACEPVSGRCDRLGGDLAQFGILAELIAPPLELTAILGLSCQLWKFVEDVPANQITHRVPFGFRAGLKAPLPDRFRGTLGPTCCLAPCGESL